MSTVSHEMLIDSQQEKHLKVFIAKLISAWCENLASHTEQSFYRCTLRLQNDLYCVGWGVKLYSLTHYRCPWRQASVLLDEHFHHKWITLQAGDIMCRITEVEVHFRLGIAITTIGWLVEAEETAATASAFITSSRPCTGSSVVYRLHCLQQQAFGMDPVSIVFYRAQLKMRMWFACH